MVELHLLMDGPEEEAEVLVMLVAPRALTQLRVVMVELEEHFLDSLDR